MRLPTSLLVLTAAAPLASAGGIAVFQGPPSGPGDVFIVDPTGSAPPSTPSGLQGIRLLPLEVDGRTQLERFLPGRAWLETDVPGAARVVLPAGQGSLYHFARTQIGSGEVFGYFVVDEQGDARVVLELTGTGASSAVDPFGPRVATAHDGKALLVATTPAAGGNLLEVDLELGGSIDRTTSLSPQQFLPGGLALRATWGIAVARTALLRFDRASSADASAIPFSGTAPTWLQGEVVLSRNGMHAATVAGAGPALAHVWTFGTSGPAVQVSETPASLSGAGFLPDVPHGPFLAVSDDGSACAWRREGTTREAFLGRVQPPLGQSPQQVTSDSFFTDTLDEIGQYIFKPGSAKAVLAVGSLGQGVPPPVEFESVDVFEVWLDAGGVPQFQNLTLTSGVTQPPFLGPGELKPQMASWTPAQDVLVFHDDDGNGQLVAALPGQSGLQVLIPDAKDLDRLDRAGMNLVAVVRRETGNKDRELHLIQPGLGAATKFFSMPDTHDLLRSASRADGVYAFVQTTPTSESLWAYDPAAGQLGLMTPRPLVYGPTLGLAPGGEIGFTVGLLGSPAVYGHWPFPASAQRLVFPTSPGFVLPGA